MKKFLIFTFIIFANFLIKAQENSKILYLDTLETWNLHFQFTSVNQYHPAFHALYSGANSLKPEAEEAMSVTSTLFYGQRLWKGAAIYINPEIAGGKGMSSALGVAGYPNGECFRIGDPTPTLYAARYFLYQHIALSNEGFEKVDDDENSIKDRIPANRLTITAGKFSLADVFDDNLYAHNSREQFMNWALMGSGAWDYAANTRGYNYGLALELIYPQWAFRVAGSSVPKVANGPELEFKFNKAMAFNCEFEYKPAFLSRPGSIRLLAFKNFSRAGNYLNSVNNFINKTDSSLNVNSLPGYGGKKIGLSLSADQEIFKNFGVFLRTAWNDGHYATWAFTEIDRSFSTGINLDGEMWHRKDDNLGLAIAVNGISDDHIKFLNAGGYGFIIGDGKLTNYGNESIIELYYLMKISAFLYLTADYQFVNNPAYNKDRGPVNIFALRMHTEF
jgi:high affinity Mn2+ porin